MALYTIQDDLVALCTTQDNSVVHAQNLTMGNENQGLTVGNGSPVMTDPNGGLANSSTHNEKFVPVIAASSSDVVNSVVADSEVVSSETVAEAISKEVTQETARRQLPMYQGAYIDGFIQGIDATLTIDTGACDTIVSCRLFEKISEDHRPQLLEVCPRGVFVGNL